MHRALILILTLFLASEASAGRVIVRVPEGINLSQEKMTERLAGAAPSGAGRYDTFDIVVYYYSLGVETLSYTDADTLSATMKGGGIRALIKCKKNNILEKALFIEAEGADEDRILENFRRAVSDAIRGL
jgi:hypothetical protein